MELRTRLTVDTVRMLKAFLTTLLTETMTTSRVRSGLAMISYSAQSRGQLLPAGFRTFAG